MATQAAVSAQLQRGLNPLTMTQLTGHPLLTQSHHGMSIGSSPTPHHLAHGHVMEQSDQDMLPKRPRLYIESKPSLHQPLHIDTGANSGAVEVNKKVHINLY